jgi:Flp pilus assembly protein protease CpaA
MFMAGNGDYKGMAYSAAAAVMIAAVLFPLFAVGVLGGGDVKLCAMLGFYMRPADAAGCVAASFVTAAVIGMVKLCRNRLLRERMGYFLSYAADVRKTGQIRLYGHEMMDTQYRAAIRPYQIHFALPVLIGAIMKLNGFY